MNAVAADPATLVVGGGFMIAFVFGLMASRANFCTMGALSDIVNMGHWGRMRMWLLAVAVAVAGTTALRWGAQVDLAKAVTMRPSLAWLSQIVGGLLFGVGMTLSGGCASKNLLRLGGGSVRSLVVLVFMGIAAYMTLKGLFAQWRASWLDREKAAKLELALTEREVILTWVVGGFAVAIAKGELVIDGVKHEVWGLGQIIR